MNELYLRILLIDDDEDDYIFTKSLLSKVTGFRYELEWISDYEKALSRVLKNEHDIYLLDYRLGAQSGLDILKEAVGKSNRAPFIILTGQGDSEIDLRAMSEGASDYLVKGKIDSQLLERSIRYSVEGRKLEEKLLISQKMETIGNLAAGIAHDLNNLMTVVLGNSTDALSAIDQSSPIHVNISETIKAAESASSLVKQLLAFGRKQMLNIETLNVNTLLSNLSNMLQRVIGENIKLSFAFAPDISNVRIDAGQFQQVIINLAIKARDAMPQGGPLKISSCNSVIDAEYCLQVPDARPGSFVCIEIQDAGKGMEKELIKHIFEPFFSTKGLGKGTGLGLSTAYGIIKQHDGWISVSSEPGKGSVFSIYLPSTLAPANEIITNAPEKLIKTVSAKARSKARILVVEDEAGVRKFVVRVLAGCGYEVFDAENAASAIRIFEREIKAIDMIFSDIILPDINGIRLVEQLLTHNADLKVIFTSGYTGEKNQIPLIEEKGFLFIP